MAKTNAAETNDFFKPDYFKVPDFGQFQADFNRWVSDFSKSFANGKTPTVDMETLFASQRKNFEAFQSANQLAFDGVRPLPSARPSSPAKRSRSSRSSRRSFRFRPASRRSS